MHHDRKKMLKILHSNFACEFKNALKTAKKLQKVNWIHLNDFLLEVFDFVISDKATKRN